jgi:segregation and condensation protein A
VAHVKDGSPAPENVEDGALASVSAPRDAFRVALPNFEGPLDLLLHLIREHRIDILDIPIALITEKYLEHLERMRQIDLDIAGEFLVMASTLLHLKSRLVLPQEQVPRGQDSVELPTPRGDPRAELVRRLLEYQKYRAVADQLHQHDILDRTVFTRRVSYQEVPLGSDEVGFHEISVYRLIEGLDRVLAALEPRRQHEVTRDHVSLSQAMYDLAQRVRSAGDQPLAFLSLFEGHRVRSQVVVTFLALLEMCKLGLVRVFQGGDDPEAILISARGQALESFGMDGGLSPSEEADREYR